MTAAKLDITEFPELAGLLRPRVLRDLASFGERHLWISEGPLVVRAGVNARWNRDVDPLCVAPLQAFEDKRWNEVCLCGTPQTAGKTMTITLIILSTLFQHGTSVLYHTPAATLSQAVWMKKIAPALLADRDLRRLIILDRDLAGTKEQRNFTNGTTLYVRGSESRAALAGVTATVVIADDVQAMQTLPEGDHPVDLARERAGSFEHGEGRYLLAGQPGMVDDYLSVKLFGGAFYVPMLPCPHCGLYQMLEWERMVYPDDPEAALTETHMQCARQDCDYKLRSRELGRMLPRHKWVSNPPGVNWVTGKHDGEGALRAEKLAEGLRGVGVADLNDVAVYPETERRTTSAGFWRSAFYWAWSNWGGLAQQYLESAGNPTALINFQKARRGVPYKPPEIDEEKLDQAEIATHVRPGYAAGTVPSWCDVVTVTVDVQSGYVYYLVRGWRKADGESALIQLGTFGRPLSGRDESKEERQQRRVAGITAGLDEVLELCAPGWEVVEEERDQENERAGEQGAAAVPPKIIYAGLGLVDRGYEPNTVGMWWRTKGCGLFKMIKGQKAGQKADLWPLRAELDKRKRPMRFVNVNEAKTILRRLLRILPSQPGYWHMPEYGIHPNTLRAYYRHIASERWNNTLAIPRWEPVDGIRANHFLDCEAYQVSAAIACGVRLLGYGRTG